MKAFLKAIIDRFKADPMAASMIGGLHLVEAPAGTAFPYMSFNVDNVQDWTFSELFENGTIQFDIYSESPTIVEIADLYALVTGNRDIDTGFDFADLTISGYLPISLVRENSKLLKWEVEGKTVWNWMIVYRFKIQKT